MDGTRAGLLASRGEGGSGGDLAAFRGGDFAAFGSATLDTLALTRTPFTLSVGVFSSGSAVVGRAGEEQALALDLFRPSPRSCEEDALTLRSRGKELEVGVAAVYARSRGPVDGDAGFDPLGRAVSLALTAGPADADPLATRELGGLKGDGARVGAAVLTDGETETAPFATLRGCIVALLLTLAFGLTRGGDREVAGCLKGDVGRGSYPTLTVT